MIAPPDLFLLFHLWIGTLLDCYDELGTRYQIPIYCLSAPINLIEEVSDAESPSPESEPMNESAGGEEIVVKFRLSTTCTDIKVPILTKETVFAAKKKLAAREGIEPARQRWYFGGRLLSDKQRIEDIKLQSGYVIIYQPVDFDRKSKEENHWQSAHRAPNRAWSFWSRVRVV